MREKVAYGSRYRLEFVELFPLMGRLKVLVFPVLLGIAYI